MIHQGHIFNTGDSERIADRRCVRVGYDPHDVFPLGSKAFVNAEMYEMVRSGNGQLKRSGLIDLHPGLGFGSSVDVHSLFPARHGNPAFAKSSIDIKNLKIVNGKRLYNLHYIRPIDKFSEREMEYVTNYVDRFGAVTLKFVKHSAAVDFALQLKGILSLYKYQTTFGANFQHSGNDFFGLGRSYLYVTFMDVNYCVPIWNPKKVDGMGVLVQLISEGAALRSGGNPITAFTIPIILTNYMENVFKVDGCNANPIDKLGDDVIGSLLSMTKAADKHEKSSVGKQGKAKAKEKSYTGKATVKSNGKIRYTNTATYSTYDASSTASNYTYTT